MVKLIIINIEQPLTKNRDLRVSSYGRKAATAQASLTRVFPRVSEVSRHKTQSTVPWIVQVVADARVLYRYPVLHPESLQLVKRPRKVMYAEDANLIINLNTI